MKKHLSILIISYLLVLTSAAQDPDKKTDWWGNIDGYVNQQDKFTLALVRQALKENPPAVDETLARKMALLMIDNVMHEEKAPLRPAVQEFFHSRIAEAIDEIKSTRVEKGAMIWKMYDHAWIVKTPSVTIAFDLQRGIPNIPEFITDKAKMKELIDVTDILFISHYHGDHADSWVAEQFIAQNKPVITPPGIFENLPVYSGIQHPERIAHKVQEFALPEKKMKLKAVIYPGHQGEKILNNVALVITAEGLTFCHTGDQSYNQDFGWIDKICDHFSLDVLLINSWSFQQGRMPGDGYKPKLIIPGHENELAHTIDHREPYWLNYNRLGDKTTYPWLQMAWGEKYHYFR